VSRSLLVAALPITVGMLSGCFYLLPSRGGGQTVVATGDHAPWTGVDFHQGSFYIAEGGERGGGRILRVGTDGRTTVLVEGIPSMGDHHTNGPRVGRDGWVYFGVGTATNSGVVGVDNYDFGWLRRYPQLHDTPCRDVTLAGRNYTTPNPLTPDPRDRVATGAFVPFGTPTREGQVIPGRMPCHGAILRLRPGGGTLELVAWGLRNPFGLAWSPDGRLYVTENQYDVRGSRPAGGKEGATHPGSGAGTAGVRCQLQPVPPRRRARGGARAQQQATPGVVHQVPGENRDRGHALVLRQGDQ
jgi:hypothetical protein